MLGLRVHITVTKRMSMHPCCNPSSHFHHTKSVHLCIHVFTQDLSTIGPRRYESKTVPGKGMGKFKRKLENSQVSSVPKKARG